MMGDRSLVRHTRHSLKKSISVPVEKKLMIADSQAFQGQLQDIETAAVALAWGAGRILSDQFGRQLSIEYKDKNQLDPVTSADKATQEYLVNEIARRFPSHGILGEEGSDETDPTGPAPDFLWVLDPLGRNHQLS